MLNKRKLCLIVCLICFLSLPLQAQAQTSPQTQTNTSGENQNNNLEEELQQYVQQEQSLNSQLSDQTQQELALDVKILSLQQSLQTINEGIAQDQNTLQTQQKQLQDLQTKQNQLKTQRQEDSDKLGNLLSTFYQNGNEDEGFLPFAEVLFESSSMSDFLDRWEYVSYIINDFEQLNQKISSSNASISQQQSLINEQMASIQTSLQEKEQLQQSQQQLLATQQNLLAQINSQEKTTILSALSSQSNIDIVEQLMQEQGLETSLVAAGRKAGINPSDLNLASPGSIIKQLQPFSGSFSAILTYAEQYLGTPYVWGGTSPSPGFDCSGFVQYVYGHFGINLARVSEDQYTEGVGIPESDLKPGDLVFFSTYEAGASHVGIYIGNNIMIDSEAYGVSFDNITNSYWAARYLGARRIVLFENNNP
ncbi:NlpC/P60 family protein [Desulfosporosinus sp. PR]|uniref:C40 family peptidase n=1 Tax=Candidatus Desulfosporosinus nitrosoreducens TaxID=3401928 RepID=UPI0027FD8221|nr:NlpC/P60 family protein [Desulfosporosinus sp. PR]MDQ7093200.1 NlpC/P60 family protein [Desulfosporosinus sp. PR]